MKKSLTLDNILNFEPAYRRNLINSISGFKACSLVGTISHRNIANVAIFNSVVHIGATPPLLGFIMRPLTVPRQTYHNIKAQGYFTINAVAKSFFKRAHQTSAKYDEQTSEFEACGLTPLYTEAHPAPYVEESPVKLGLQFEEEHHIKANGTILMIGKIIEVIAEESLISPNGHLNLDKAGILTVAGLSTYYEPKLLGRLGFARP